MSTTTITIDGLITETDVRRIFNEMYSSKQTSAETSTENDILKQFVTACKYGGVGFSANILLHNASCILRDIGENTQDEEKKVAYLACADALKEKADLEFNAIKSYTNIANAALATKHGVRP